MKYHHKTKQTKAKDLNVELTANGPPGTPSRVHMVVTVTDEDLHIDKYRLVAFS